MAVREIKTRLTVDSEKQFNREIKEAGRNMRVMASEMKAAAADFNLTGNEMDYLTRKSDSLNAQIRQQENIIEALKDAVASSAKAWGDASEKTDGFRIKLAGAEANLAKLKKELQQSDAEMAELGRDSGRVGRQLEQGIGEAADDVGKKFDQMVKKLDVDLSEIGSAVNFSAFVDGTELAADAVRGTYEAITGLVDTSMDYNRQMSFLEVNAAAAGHSFEKIKQYAMDVSVITGDMDAAIEGMSMLLNTGFEGEELAKAVEILKGIIIDMPDGMKFENLAESLLESVSTGSAVGQYAEYLEKVGMDIETVNEALAEARKNGQEAAETAALSLLSGHGAEEVLAQWKTDNAEMIEYYQAQASLTEAQAALAKELTPAATAMIELATDLIEAGTGLVGAGKELYETWKTENDEKQKETEETRKRIDEDTGLYSDLDEINAAIFEADTDGNYAEANRLMAERTRLIHEIAAATKEMETTEEDGAEATKENMLDVSDAVKDARASLQSWEEMESGLTKEMMQELFDKEAASQAGKEAGDAGTAEFDKSMAANMPDVLMNSELDGRNAIISMANGMAAEAELARRTAADVWALVNQELSRPFGFPSLTITGGGTAGEGAAGTGNTRGVSLYLDGRELGRTEAPYISDAQGARVDRYETYGY